MRKVQIPTPRFVYEHCGDYCEAQNLGCAGALLVDLDVAGDCPLSNVLSQYLYCDTWITRKKAQNYVDTENFQPLCTC